ncbi:hypothetical protein ABPG74_001979 [Tetrahymena malaccensis]
MVQSSSQNQLDLIHINNIYPDDKQKDEQKIQNCSIQNLMKQSAKSDCQDLQSSNLNKFEEKNEQQVHTQIGSQKEIIEIEDDAEKQKLMRIYQSQIGKFISTLIQIFLSILYLYVILSVSCGKTPVNQTSSYCYLSYHLLSALLLLKYQLHQL